MTTNKNNKVLVKFESEIISKPVSLTAEESLLCNRLDDFYKHYDLKNKPSEYYRGAIYCSNEDHRSNPDWLAQAAHSLREILYPFYSSKSKDKTEFKKTKAFSKFTNINIDASFESELGKFYGKLNEVAHHGKTVNFTKLKHEFNNVMKQLLLHQLQIHSMIDDTLNRKIMNSITYFRINNLISVNDDAKQYFYSKVDEKWLKWLWENDFLEDVYKKAEDLTQYSFRMPELNYLVRIAESIPDVITEIILDVKISKDSYNPEVVDQFTSICSKLSSVYLKKIVKKIRDEKWVILMGSYTLYGFEYADMLKKLNESRDYESLLILSEAILTVRSKDNITEKNKTYTEDDIFYIHDIVETKVFSYLLGIDPKYNEQTISLVCSILKQAIGNSEEYALYDVDFFKLNLREAEDDSYKEDIKCLVAVICELLPKMFDNLSGDTKKIINLYDKYIDTLPKTKSMNRLRLYVQSLKPDIFKKDLINKFNRLFTSKNYYDEIQGAEYEQALKKSFHILNSKEQREYINNVFNLFSKKVSKDEDKRWNKHYGSSILSVLFDYLADEDKKRALEVGFHVTKEYEPEPTIRKILSGEVNPQPPIISEEFSKLPILDIVTKLKYDWTPEELKKIKNQDFLNPRDADGVSILFKDDIKKRISDYLENADVFFDRNVLIPHYTNSYLRGILEALEENRQNKLNYNFEKLFVLLEKIMKSDLNDPFVKKNTNQVDRWLANWNYIPSTICDLIETLIKQKDTTTIINFRSFRKKILNIISYLLSYPDPVTEDEKIKTARETTKDPSDKKYQISDPFSIAINSVRGRAFQVLLHYIFQDNKNFSNAKISKEVKKIYKKVLSNENTRAVMFMFGRYLPTFYYRDRKWIMKTTGLIFNSKSKNKYLKLAALEGYLSSDVYKEIFFEPKIQKLYSQNILTKNIKYPNQKFFKNPKESLAIHMALAFTFYQEFDFDHKLFKKFWSNASINQISEFVSFIGKMFISGNDTKADTFIKENNWLVQRLLKLWEILMTTKYKNVIEKMGSWMSLEKNIFNPNEHVAYIRKSFELTKGKIEWSYELMKNIEKISTENSDDALKILELYFLNTIKEGKKMGPIYMDKEWYKAFRNLYNSSDAKLKNKTYILINKLIEKGGRPFWSLEEIVKQR